MLLGRLQADCEYYLGFGNKSPHRLWAGSDKTQIEYMTKIHDSFRENEKPEWLDVYKRQVVLLVAKIIFFVQAAKNACLYLV